MKKESVKEKQKTIECPHCSKNIQLCFRVELIEVRTGNQTTIKREDGLTSEQKEFLNEAKENGLLTSFQKTVEKVKAGQPPKSIEKFFLLFFRTAVQRSVPFFARDYFRKEFKGQNIQFWSAQGIGAVVVDGIIKLFLPNELLAGKSVKTLRGKLIGRTGVSDERGLTEWAHSRFGLVVGKGEFFARMQKRCVGEFEKTIN